MHNRKIFIVEDDPIIASDLAGILEDLGYRVCGIAHEPFEARKKIESEKPDLLLMDVNLGSSIDGIDLATLVKRQGTGIIFITAFTDKTTRDRIKTLNPLAYIIKPFDEKDIEVAIDLAMHKLSEEISSPQVNTSSPDSIFVKTGSGVSRKIIFNDVIMIEAYDNYSFIYSGNEKIMVSLTLKDLEQKFTAPDFLRTHRSYIINVSKVDAIRNGALILGTHEVPIGKSYKEEVLRHFPTL